MLYAGGFVLGSLKMVLERQIANLVGRGFVVVTPEYRLCPQVSLYEGPIQDAKDVYRWCQEELPRLLKESRGVEVDASRIVAMGHQREDSLLSQLDCVRLHRAQSSTSAVVRSSGIRGGPRRCPCSHEYRPSRLQGLRETKSGDVAPVVRRRQASLV
jgi:hypothetical protein